MHFKKDPYWGVVIVLATLTLFGTLSAVVGTWWLSNPLLLDLAITLGLSTGMLAGVAIAQYKRANPFVAAAEEAPAVVETQNTPEPEPEEGSTPAAPSDKRGKWIQRRIEVPARVQGWFQELGEMGRIRAVVAGAGLVSIGWVLETNSLGFPPPFLVAAIAALICLVAAALAATAVHYFAGITPEQFPEASGIRKGARVVGWTLVFGAVGVFFAWANLEVGGLVIRTAILIIDSMICFGLIVMKQPEAAPLTFPLELEVFSVLGSRPNIFGSALDSAESQLGIDLRSTWALTIVRRSVEPLVIGLCFVAWLTTSLTVVGVDEQGLVERFGVPVGGPVLQPGLHLHFPWPIDKVFRIPVQRIQALSVGHEGEEEGGPEDVVWTVEHAVNEYTLLLGNGRDLITIDAAVQFRIVDSRAWQYNSQNPLDALRAIAYRAVMRSTVNLTLSEALSENVVTLTGGMRAMVQQEADALGLGVAIVGFTIGGMHPPVPVAGAYEAVVSAELGKVTAVVDAQVFRNETLPSAQAIAFGAENLAKAEGAQALAQAAGEAWSFRTLESQFRTAPSEYFFRRRLEKLESGLAGRHLTIVDSRFQRDGGELWLTQ